MKYLILSLLIVSVSCQLPRKNAKKKAPKLFEDEATPVKQNYVLGKEFWPQKYYHQTTVTVQKPKYKFTEEEFWSLCKGPTLEHLISYEGPRSGRVRYLASPVLFYTASGFKKEVYITTGMCRELALHSSSNKDTVKIDAHRNLRYKLKSMTIEFVYTEKSFATELVFDSKYKGVDFTVR